MCALARRDFRLSRFVGAFNTSKIAPSRSLSARSSRSQVSTGEMGFCQAHIEEFCPTDFKKLGDEKCYARWARFDCGAFPSPWGAQPTMKPTWHSVKPPHSPYMYSAADRMSEGIRQF